MNTWQSLIIRLSRLNTDQYIRELHEEIAARDAVIARLQGFTTVYIDPNMRTAYAQPQRTTAPIDPLQQAMHDAHVSNLRTRVEMPKIRKTYIEKFSR